VVEAQQDRDQRRRRAQPFAGLVHHRAGDPGVLQRPVAAFKAEQVIGHPLIAAETHQQRKHGQTDCDRQPEVSYGKS
jgi:hypothetical protein